jgi:WD40 repeat protein
MLAASDATPFTFNHSVQIFDICTGHILKVLKLEPNQKARRMAFSPDSTMLGIVSTSGFLLKDLKTEKILWEKTFFTMQPSYFETHFTFSPDNKILAICHNSSKVDLIDLVEVKKIGELDGHKEPVTSIAFSFDGDIIATGSRDKTIRIWNTETAEELRILIGHTESVTGLAFNEHTDELISGGSDGKIKFWDWKPLPSPKPQINIKDDILTPNYEDLQNKRYLSIEKESGRINIWNAETTKDDKPLSFSCSGPIEFLCYSPNGNCLAAANDREVMLFNILTKQIKEIYVNEKEHIPSREAISGIKLSNNNLVIEYDVGIAVCDFDGNQIPFDLPLDEVFVSSYAISNDGKIIAFEGGEGFQDNIWIWDVHSNSALQTIKLDENDFFTPTSMLFDTNAEKLICLNFGSDGIRIYNLATGEIKTIKDDDIHCDFTLGGLTVDNNLVVIKNYWPSNKELIQIWNIQTGELIRSIDSIDCDRFSEKLQYSSQYVAKPIEANKIKIIDLNSKKDICSVDGHLPVIFSPNCKLFAVANSTIVEINPIKEDSKSYSIEDVGHISLCSFFDDGDSIIAIIDDNVLTVWQAKNGKEIHRIEHDQVIKHIAVDPRRIYIATILNDGFVVVRNHDNFSAVSSFQTNQGGITTLSFDPDTRRVITGGIDETLKIWDIESGMELLTLTRNFNTRTIISDSGYSATDENAKIAFTQDGHSIIHRSGKKLDLNKIDERNFESYRAKEDHEFLAPIYQSRESDLEQIESLIQLLPNGMKTKMYDGRSLLDTYIGMKRFDVAQYLIEEEAEFLKADMFYCLTRSDNIEKEDKVEIFSQKKGFVNYLLDKGLDLNDQTLFGYTPLHIAILNNQLELAEYLIEKLLLYYI